MRNRLLILKNYIKYKYILKFKTRESLEKYQDKKIKKHIKFIKKNSNFYKNLYGGKKEFSELPIIDKKLMMDNFDTFNTVGIIKEDALKVATFSEKTRKFEGKIKGIDVGLSSGTSGHRGIFLVAEDEKNQWAGAILAKILPQNILKKTKIAFFLRANNNLYESVNTKKIRLQYFDMMKPIDEHIDTLVDLNPNLLIAPPQVLIELSRKNMKKEILINPTKIVSVAEVLEDRDKKLIQDSFKLDVIHQVYQCTEGFIAQTCKYGTLHVNEDILKLEKEPIDENRFIPIITDFTRKSQPIVRYRLNDILVEKKEPCRCGSIYLSLEKVEGREDDCFFFRTTKSKELVTIYPDFIRRTLLYIDDIKEFRVIQESENEILIELDNITEDITRDIEKEFKELSIKMDFITPSIKYKKFSAEKGKKLRRIQNKFIMKGVNR